jgi:hypothetical protein
MNRKPVNDQVLEAVERVRQTAARHRETERAEQAARRDMVEAIVEARAAGATLRSIAQAAHVTHGWITQLVQKHARERVPRSQTGVTATAHVSVSPPTKTATG